MAAPIKKGDTTQDRLSKLLPADITATFLSAKAGILTYVSDPIDSAPPVFWTFITILVISPFYFWFVSAVRNITQLIFLCLSFIVFAVSIASSQFVAYFTGMTIRGVSITSMALGVITIVLPIVWVFLIAQIFAAAIGKSVEG